MRDLRSADLKGLWTFERELRQCNDFEAVGEVFKFRLPRMISAEFHNINRFSPGMAEYLGIQCTNGVSREAAALQRVFHANFAYHPLTAQCGVVQGLKMLMADGVVSSDLVTLGAFRANPLYKLVYRPLQTDYQMLIGLSLDAEGVQILGINRRISDFSTRDRGHVLAVANALRGTYARLTQHQRLSRMVTAVASIWDVDAKLLTPRELKLIADVMVHGSVAQVAQFYGVRRDSAEKEIGVIRRKLGVGTTEGLLSKFLIGDSLK